MLTIHRHYFDFCTDLDRLVYCLTDNNKVTADTFLDHANSIYNTYLVTDELKIFTEEVTTIWNNINKIPNDSQKQLLYADKVITLTSMIFSRTMTRLNS